MSHNAPLTSGATVADMPISGTGAPPTERPGIPGLGLPEPEWHRCDGRVLL